MSFSLREIMVHHIALQADIFPPSNDTEFALLWANTGRVHPIK